MVYINTPIPPQDDERKKSTAGVVLKEYVIPVGALLLAIVPIFTQKNLPLWAWVTLVVFVLIVAAFLVFPILIRSISYSHKWLLQRRLERQYLPRVVSILKRVKPMLESHRGDTLWGVWENSARTIEMQKYIRPERSHFDALSTWHQNLCEIVEKTGPTKFELVTRFVGQWLQRYVSFGREAYTQFENLLRDDQIAEPKLREIKQDWNHARDDHNRLINDWKALCEEINGESEHEIFSGFYETLKPLE